MRHAPLLQQGRMAARALREGISRSEAGFLADEARVERLQLNYDAACENFAEATRLDPGNCWIWVELGDLWVLRGSLAEAEKAFRSAVKAAGGTDQRDLSVSYDRVGDVLVAQGNLPEALKSYRDSLAIIDRLAKADPGNAGWQRDLALSYGRVAMMQSELGAHDDALGAFRRGRNIIEHLVRQSPDNGTLPQDLAWFDSSIHSLKIHHDQPS
jgi:predicted Zn-dependent protease